MHIQPRKALNKAFLKIKPNRDGIELFKNNLKLLLDKIKLIDSRPKDETEEHLKNDLRDFLRDTYYKESNAINTKDKKDLVIHHGKNTNSNVAIIIEAKRPSNKSEMFSVDNVNCKALQELILYFLRERISNKNLSITNLIITNVTKWFLFEAQLFDKLFAQNKSLVKQFEDFEAGKLSGKNTDFFYKEIAKPFIETLIDKLEYTYFDLATYDKILRNDDKQDDAKLIVLYKLLSPEHLLKLSFANDSNSLDKNFYNELLHLIGLTETKEGGKKLIERPKSGQRHAGSLLENVINQLDSLDKISRLPNVKQYGNTHEERLFTVGLELCITWVNRILFLKLLEAQLISYHKGDKSYAFLHKDLLHDYDNLNALFFMVLAKKPEERNDRVKTPFAKVPYLNSSLFEPTDLEHQALLISSLENGISLPFISATVIKDANGKKLTGERNAIDYFFDFLDAYDFASEGSEDIQEDNKTLINASVLGLIFEKINGYKDGSFYTPSFITMYMCKETIRRAVVQKFNETKGWNCEDFDALYNKIDDTQEANAIINSVKICDPAVGSGHFLVSALNEMIAIKHDLKVLTDREGKRLKEYQVDIVNDELIVTDEDGVPFTYNPKSKESQRLQETLFHEKQTIIENCLFGVDINPNSVKICRLRLWIELLKNAYYRNETELETLPNIDINIKCGNSLIARFGLDADLKEALQKSKLKIDDYKRAVDQYRNAESKEQKREMELLIAEIKTGFSSNIDNPFKDKIKKARWEVNKYETEINTKEQWGDKIEKSLLKEFDIAKKKFQKLEDEQEEIKSNKIYENAFEWRFEFPEVLNDEGDFVGFDVVIGNPPYITIGGKDSSINDKSEINFLLNKYISNQYKPNLYAFFYEEAISLLSFRGIVSFIVPRTLLDNLYYSDLRVYLSKQTILSILKLDFEVFDDAVTGGTNILLVSKEKNQNYDIQSLIVNDIQNFKQPEVLTINSSKILVGENNVFSFLDSKLLSVIEKIEQNKKVKDFFSVNNGVNTGNCAEILLSDSKESDKHFKILEGKNINKYITTWKGLWINYDHNLKKTINLEDLNTKQNKIDFALREKRIFDSNKIIIRQTGDKIIATIDENGFITRHSTHCLVNDFYSIDLKLALAQLNSKLIDFYYNYLIPEKGKAFAEVKGINIKQLPLVCGTELDNNIILKVDQILSLKKDNLEADTTALEREIDFMVYELYGLTQEEIEIVENS